MSSAADPRPRLARRRYIALALILSLTATAVLQYVVQEQRRKLLAAHSSTVSDLSSLDSYALALVLGGLRGPLVMALWTTSETQKSHHQLEDFSTKIEWIRQLQPEFDSVHIFQIWNLAYNVSQQMASLSNKYAAVLDGLDYAHKVMAQRPNNINIFSSVADVYFNKLGSSSEREFYTQRIRRESFAPVRITMPAHALGRFQAAAAQAGLDDSLYSISTDDASGTAAVVTDKLSADAVLPLFQGTGITSTYTPAQGVGMGRRSRFDVVLDANGNLLADLVTPKVPPPAHGGEYNDGSELQYLKAYQPFPYGVPPLALGWNYYKRAQVLQTTTGQKHLQLTDQVVDSRPPITMKLWAEGEIREGLEQELQGLGRNLQEDQDQGASLGLVTAQAPPDAHVAHGAMLEEAIYHYDLAARLADDTDAEFARNLRYYAINTFLYRSHRDELLAEKALALADRDYLAAMLTPPAQRQPWIDSARAAYQRAAVQWELMILKYGPDEPTASRLYPRGYNQDRLAELSPQQLAVLVARYYEVFHPTRLDSSADQRVGFEQHLQRCRERLTHLPPA